MAKSKRCCFCRFTIEHHVGILWDGLASCCVTLKYKVTDKQRQEYAERFKPVMREWGRVFGGNPPEKSITPSLSGNGHGK